MQRATRAHPSRVARYVMQRPWLHRLLLLVSTTCIGLVSATALHAQSVTFTGKVSSEGGQPLAGANVGITELGIGGVAATDGRYTFTIDQARIQGRTLN